MSWHQHETIRFPLVTLLLFPQELRPVHHANTQQLFATVLEIRELSTGYAWRLPHETSMLQTIAAFLSYEQLCCPFFHFTLETEPDQGPLWLYITGMMDVKALLQSEGWIPSEEI